jgi:hypothetical protein
MGVILSLSKDPEQRPNGAQVEGRTEKTKMLLHLALSVILSAATPAPAPAATAFAPAQISALLANPTSFDSQHLSVTGAIAQLAEKTSRRGNDYTTFDLCDGTSSVHVYSYGHPKLTNGQTLTVSGKFFADKHVGSLDFKNELDADEGSLP